MTNRRTRSLGLLATLLLGMVALAGCVGTVQDDTPPAKEKLAGSLTELFEQKLQNQNLSDFERDVIERAARTGAISQADYDEAFNRYQRCLSDLGYTETWEKLSSGLYRVTSPAPTGKDALEKYWKQTEDCAEGTTRRIEALFAQQQGNPDLNADSRVTVIQCLVKGGYVDVSYTTDRLDKDLESGFTSAPYDVTAAGPNECFYNAGFAIAIQ